MVHATMSDPAGGGVSEKAGADRSPELAAQCDAFPAAIDSLENSRLKPEYRAPPLLRASTASSRLSAVISRIANTADFQVYGASTVSAITWSMAGPAGKAASRFCVSPIVRIMSHPTAFSEYEHIWLVRKERQLPVLRPGIHAVVGGVVLPRSSRSPTAFF